jgi:hypothetical protein
MKISGRRTLVLLHSVLLASAPGCASLLSDSDSVHSRIIQQGVVHRHIVRGQAPWVINVLEIDLTRPELSIGSGRALGRIKGRETTSSMAARYNDTARCVVAALNADFFDTEGFAVSAQVSDAQVVRAKSVRLNPQRKPYEPRTQVGITMAGAPVIERLDFAGFVVAANGVVDTLMGVNVSPAVSGWTLFNSFFGDSTALDTSGSVVVEGILEPIAASGDTSWAVVRERRPGGGMRIPRAGLVLRSRGAEPQLFPSSGDTVSLVLRFEPYAGPMLTLVGGLPRLIVNGESVAGLEDYREGSNPEFSSNRHPRTGVGFSRDSTTMFWVVVDGRQKSSSGMSLPEFADLMISLGVYQGANLDGGGSTTMVVENAVVNMPSDAAGERPVANCLLLFARRTQARADSLDAAHD